MCIDMIVIKRNGTKVKYDRSKIMTAVRKANTEVEEYERISDIDIEQICYNLEKLGRNEMQVEEIQDFIENQLIDRKLANLARKYIADYLGEKTV